MLEELAGVTGVVVVAGEHWACVMWLHVAVCLQVTVGVHLTIPDIARAVQNRKSAENISCTGSQWLETSATIMCVSSFFFVCFTHVSCFIRFPAAAWPDSRRQRNWSAVTSSFQSWPVYCPPCSQSISGLHMRDILPHTRYAQTTHRSPASMSQHCPLAVGPGCSLHGGSKPSQQCRLAVTLAWGSVLTKELDRAEKTSHANVKGVP